MRDPMLLSVRVRPLTYSEVLLLRLLSRIEGRPATLFRMATRFRFLRHAIGTSLGCRAARGLSAAEAALVFLLVDHPAETAEELRLKAASVRDHLDATGNGNAAAMLCAGLQADAHRLGLLAGAEAVGFADPAFH